jgi:hypothetical protein
VNEADLPNLLTVLAEEAGVSVSVVVHALLYCSGKVEAARRYLRGENVM